jgi:hypothetical protein
MCESILCSIQSPAIESAPMVHRPLTDRPQLHTTLCAYMRPGEARVAAHTSHAARRHAASPTTNACRVKCHGPYGAHLRLHEHVHSARGGRPERSAPRHTNACHIRHTTMRVKHAIPLCMPSRQHASAHLVVRQSGMQHVRAWGRTGGMRCPPSRCGCPIQPRAHAPPPSI